jgi:NADH dehydrogenase [ubiquinone] 1 alpha subcomplex assembly factor 6
MIVVSIIVCGLLLPAKARKQYFALRAFNAELASIKDGSDRRRLGPSEEAGSSLGQRMRFQWWREALDGLYPDGQGDSSDAANVNNNRRQTSGFLSSISASYGFNPVVRALGHAVQESNLTRRFLERLLDAREADMDLQQLPTLDNAIMYAEDSTSSILYLTLECCDVREDAADEVASNVGVGCGLVTAIRSAPYRAVQGEMSIPAELLTSQKFQDYLSARHNPDYQYSADNEKALREAVQHMAYVASTFLARARDTQFDVPKKGRIAMIAAVPAIHYLEKLKEVEYDLFDARLHPEQSRLILLTMMGRTWLTGKF